MALPVESVTVPTMLPVTLPNALTVTSKMLDINRKNLFIAHPPSFLKNQFGNC
jgi:hypothetical protein